MLEIPEDTVFTRPHILTAHPNSQVSRCHTRSSKGPSAEAILKFYSFENRIAYDKEVKVYRYLQDKKTEKLHTAEFLGHAEWSHSKYVKVVGKKNASIAIGSNSTIYVVMLQPIHNTQQLASLPSLPISLVVSALSQLWEMHVLEIIHGDVSATNILVGDDDVVAWVDFSCSWTKASAEQRRWEMDTAKEYFALWVFPSLSVFD
jgi:RIO-like serine/threonine protein kinase